MIDEESWISGGFSGNANGSFPLMADLTPAEDECGAREGREGGF